jgi:glycosyltransferase involved in cell wall biosynthesis
MRVSIIIPTYNRRELLLRTLSSLEAQTVSPTEFEVIVVVDGSTDGTVGALEEFKALYVLKTIVQSNQGQASARNAGAEQASSELLLFLDDDILCSPELVAAHIALAQRGANAVVFGPVFLADTSARSIPAEAYRGYAEARFSRIREFGPTLPQDAMLAPNSSISADLLRRVGGYNTSLARLEDIELGYRLWKLGTAFIYAPDANAYHEYDKDAETLVRRDAIQFGESDVKLCRMHPEYRPFSTIRHFVESRSLLARVAASLPFSPDRLFSLIYSIAVRFQSAPRFAIRLLQKRQGVAALRSAVTFAGGWLALTREFRKDNAHA